MPINVLIAEDSSFQRKVISEMISSHKDIVVVDMARNGIEVIEKVEKLDPDVLLLDLIMPEMDGLTAFKHIMQETPIPTIIFSVLDPKTMDDSVQALLMGAIDYIVKPGGLWKVELPKFREQLIEKIFLASKSKKGFKKQILSVDKSGYDKIKTKEVIQYHAKELLSTDLLKTEVPIISKGLDSNVIVIGTSVGGPKTLKLILQKIPKDFSCPILMVQHLDTHFMIQFAQSLDQLCSIKVKIAENDEKIAPGVVYLAPGARHMKIVVKHNKPFVKIIDEPPINFCKPSVDPLFLSAAKVFKNRALGIILTGLGNDGVDGLEAIKLEGGRTIAESQETCVVYGMPKIAAERNAAQIILPNYKIAEYIIKFGRKFKKEV